MKKLILFLVFIGFSISVQVAYGKEATSKVYTDKMEQDLYSAIKEQAGGHSQAEIEQATGVGLLNADNQWERAEKHFKKAVELDPALYQSWYNLGLIHMGTDKGAEYFQKTIQVKPDFAPAIYWLAYNYSRQGHDKQAMPFWVQYLETAQGQNEEKERIATAREAIKEIQSGEPGTELKLIRMK